MRKVLVAVVLAAVAVGLLAWLVTRAMTGKPAAEWPLGLGMVKDVPLRNPATPVNVSAEELARLGLALGLDFRGGSYSPPPEDGLRAYVLAQAARADAIVDPAPPEVAEALAKHAVALAAIRAHLLQAELPRWPVDLGNPMRGAPSTQAHLMLNRLLNASALDRARRGDAGAWDDLHAAWRLSRSLLARPELPSVLVGVSIARIVNASARKMPLPAPPWFAEVAAFDYRRALIAAQQTDAWFMREATKADRTSPPSTARQIVRDMGRAVGEPYYRLCAADLIENLRLGAAEVAEVRGCAFDAAAFNARRESSIAPWNAFGKMAMANYGALWMRLFRFRAELEATDRALALRRGAPPPKTSACTDGEWLYDANGFHFSRAIAEPDGVTVPLSFLSPRR